jgi:hypothetical protein
VPKKLTIEECKAVAIKNGGRCLSDKYHNNYTKMLWECKSGHQWKAKFSNVKFGHWCGKCASIKNTKKLKLHDGLKKAKAWAAKRGGDCLSKEYMRSHNHMLWQCKLGHTWSATFANIKQGYWCPNCAGQVVTIDDCHAIAYKNGGKYVSDIYTNAKTKMLWECGQGHQWKARYNDIQQGRWCPLCASCKTQKLLFDIIQDIYPLYDVEFNYRGFDWLGGKTSKQEIDIFVKGVGVAIEYQGEQHFMPVRFGGITREKAVKNLKYVQKLDKIKKRKILEHKDDINFFIEFTYKDKINIKNVKDKLSKHGISWN